MAQRPFQAGVAVNLDAGKSVKDVVVCTVPPPRKRFEIKFVDINGVDIRTSPSSTPYRSRRNPSSASTPLHRRAWLK